ncbi:CBS domain-containing protein [Candidatus Fermentibacteria bacterium]|nr:CBS domain-containing protein [Candidatus Fermentibacteria bacterium]
MWNKRTDLFRLAGFQVSMDLSWLVIAFLVTWTLAAGVFPNQYPELRTGVYWMMGIACAVGLLLSIVFHELSHSLVARRFGMPIGGITLFVFGGIAQMESEPPSPKAEALMALAGPASSILIGGALYGIHALLGSGVPVTIRGVVNYLALINLALAAFNLVPAFPLDGGRVLRAGLWAWKKSMRKATRLASNVGRYFSYVLIAMGMLALLGGNFIAGIWWGLIGLFLGGAARSAYRQMLLRRELEGELVRDFMEDRPINVPSTATVEELLQGYVYRYYKKMFPVVENGKLLGCVTTEEIKKVPMERRDSLTVGEITQRCSEANTIGPDEDATKALSRMSGSGVSRLVVEKDGVPVGVITLKDLLQLLALKVDLEE